MTSDPQNWATTLEGLFDQAWLRLVRGVADRRAPARHPTFATVSPDRWPEARTVVLRAADRAAAMIEVHTDLQSSKVTALRANPRAALHIWEAGAHLQIRLSASVSILSGPEVADIWARVPDPSRQSYGTVPAPGQPIATALDYAKPADPHSFAVLRCAVQQMDLVHLGPQHRRARFLRADGWAGQWLAP
jgi:hypothetical protein